MECDYGRDPRAGTGNHGRGAKIDDSDDDDDNGDDDDSGGDYGPRSQSWADRRQKQMIMTPMMMMNLVMIV